MANGPVSDAALDMAAMSVAGEFDGAVAGMMGGGSGPSHSEAAEYLWRQWAEQAERESADGLS